MEVLSGLFSSGVYNIIRFMIAGWVYRLTKKHGKYGFVFGVVAFFMPWVAVIAIIGVYITKKEGETVDDRIKYLLLSLKNKGAEIKNQMEDQVNHQKGTNQDKYIRPSTNTLVEHRNAVDRNAIDRNAVDRNTLDRNIADRKTEEKDLLQKNSDILGVSTDADLKTIQVSYEAQLRKHDPKIMKKEGMPEEYIEYSRTRIKQVTSAYHYLRRVK